MNQHLWGIAAAAVAASCLGAASAAPKEKAALALGLKGTSTYSITQEATKPLKGSPVPNLGVRSILRSYWRSLRDYRAYGTGD